MISETCQDVHPSNNIIKLSNIIIWMKDQPFTLGVYQLKEGLILTWSLFVLFWIDVVMGVFLMSCTGTEWPASTARKRGWRSSQPGNRGQELWEVRTLIHQLEYQNMIVTILSKLRSLFNYFLLDHPSPPHNLKCQLHTQQNDVIGQNENTHMTRLIYSIYVNTDPSLTEFDGMLFS